MHSVERTKIFVNRHHFASVRSDLLLHFRQTNGIINFQPWLRKTVYEEFGIMLSDKESIAALDNMVVSRYYDNIGDWLQEYMRQKLVPQGGSGDDWLARHDCGGAAGEEIPCCADMAD